MARKRSLWAPDQFSSLDFMRTPRSLLLLCVCCFTCLFGVSWTAVAGVPLDANRGIPLEAGAPAGQTDTSDVTDSESPFDGHGSSPVALVPPKGTATLTAIVTSSWSILRPEVQVLPRVSVGLTSSVSVEGGLLVNPSVVGRYVQINPKVRLGEWERVTIAVDAHTTFVRQTALLEKGSTPVPRLRSNKTHRLKRELTWTVRTQPRLMTSLERGRALGSVGIGLAVASPGIWEDAQVYPRREQSVAPTFTVGGSVFIHPELALVSENQVYRGLTSDGVYGAGPWGVGVDAREAIMQSRSGVMFTTGPYAMGIGVILRDIPRYTSDPSTIGYLRLQRQILRPSG